MSAIGSAEIARHLVKFTFESKALVIVPECYWAGSECDLLVVTKDLRLIDVEIKVSRSDFKRDAGKDKWFHNWDYNIDGPYKSDRTRADYRKREWPRRIWKHYFAMPESIWKPEMVEAMPSQMSGVLLFRERGTVVCVRRATPSRDAEKISAENAIDIARLAGLRMWDALALAERQRRAA